MNLASIFLDRVARQPNHVAILGARGESITYGELAERIESAAEKLRLAGVEPRQTLGLHYASGLDYIVLNYAIWRCGACVVPIPVELSPEEKQRICQEITLDAAISRTEIVAPLRPCMRAEPTELGNNALLLKLRRLREHPKEFERINAAFLRFTSGTTGTSKGVVLSHETIKERIHAANVALRISMEDRVIWLLSMSYHFAVSIVAYLSFGATIVLPRNHFGVTIMQAANDHGGTLIYGAPVQYELMAHDPGRLLLPSVRLAISTTTSLARATGEAFYRRFGIGLSQAYGIIEVGLPCINVDRPIEKMGSVGCLLPSYEIRMEDVSLGEGKQAVKLRGSGFFDAYYSPWQIREEVMPDGWFATGDLGTLDRDGYLFIHGRTKEVINVAGMKLFPAETESVLNAHPAVAESCVFAHRHDRLGEVPYAHVVLASGRFATEEQLKDHCSRQVAPYKVPERIFFVDELARTASGKLIRDEARNAQSNRATHDA